jgi:hypothetical protein
MPPIVLDGTAGITTPDLTDTSLTSGRVVYAGTGGNLTGASTFVFDGSNLFVGGSSGTSRLAVANSTNDGTYNIKQYGVFGTATTYLDSDASNLWGSGLGELQIQNGTATRPAMLSMGGSVNTDEGMGVINFFRSGNDDSYRSRVQIAGVVGSTGTAGRHGGYLQVRIAADGQTDPAVAVQFSPSGTVILKGGSTSATGAGITFPAIQSASSDANTLDDYEEGTFTPFFSFATSGSVSYGTQTANYIKIGRLVQCTIALGLSAVSSPSGAVTIGGLPFNDGTGENFVSAFTVALARNFASAVTITGYVGSASTFLQISKNASNAGFSALQGSDLTASTQFYVSFTYMTA